MEDKREKLLNAALELFVTYGFHGTPTSTIAKSAGVANGTLFHYFPTKEALILELYAGIKASLAAYVSANIVESDSIKTIIKSSYLCTLYWALDNDLPFRYIQMMHNSPFLAQVPKAELTKYIQPHLDLIQTGIDQKVLKPLAADYIYSLLSSHSFGVNQYLQNKSIPRDEKQTFIAQSFDLIWDMIH